MKKILVNISLAIMLIHPTLLFADRVISLGVESFEWVEPSLKLTETGTRYSIGINSGNLLSRSHGLLHEFSGTAYQGTIDYNGGLQSGERLKSDTVYSGLKGEAKLALRGSSFDIAGALGVEKWTREIKSATTDSGKRGIGYTETYMQPYAKLGVGLFHQTGTGKGRFEIGYKLPFAVKEDVDILDDLTLEPKGADSVYIQYRYQSGRRWGVMVYSEKTHFKESDFVRAGGSAFKQPDSKSEALGAKVTYRF
jgi:hypothetical protein